MKIRLSTLATVLMVLQPLSLIAEQSNEVISPWVAYQVTTAIHESFGSNLEASVQVKRLTGGYSATSMQLGVAGKSYVLRVISESEPSLRVNTELDAMKKAAAIGVAPRIHWISADGHAILMDYIEGGTLTIERSREPEVIAKVADLLHKVHALPKNPFSAPSFEDHMEKFYNKYLFNNPNHSIAETAISIIKRGASQLQNLGSPTVNTHGDLSPRNIVVSGQELYFIDWSEVTYTEPFHDLGYFSILMDYDPKDDELLLQCYLSHTPTANENKRFLIAKKMNFARLVLGGQAIGNKLASTKKNTTNTPQPLKEWSYYAKMFANDNAPLSPQFFWDFAQAALKSANAIDLSEVN